MNWTVILSISKTHLLSRLKQSSIAALGVTFGIGTFIILVSFMTGLNQLLDNLILDRTPHVHIYNEIEPSAQQPVELLEEFSEAFNIIRSVKPKQNQEKIHNALPLLSHLKKDTRVRGVTPQVKAQVFYLAGSIKLNGVVQGVDIMEEARLFNIDDYIVQGEPQDLARNDNAILLGAGIAKKMSLEVGDKLQVATAGGDLFPLKIVGLYQSGLAEIDNVQSYTNLKTAQRILGEGNSYITDIHVKLLDMRKALEMAEEIEDQFNLSAVDINRANAQFETGTTIRNIITYAVSITLLVVAGFGIYNILNMMIYEKMNDIAILKATGFSGRDVKMIFISQAMLIGVVGGVIGLFFGYIVSVLIDHTPFETEALPTISTFPVNFNPLYYVIGIVFAIASTFLAGYLPAQRAKKIDPVEIIRGQ
ncbi:ABC transporter, permease protein [Fulvivirga imtechensis AK7]|uniref:ABC transporter, permease protein n=1 Tax=Fulvivirga imtechensis AK7 TaxID=1237149 RepID=L8JXF0_9BACT|nr:ABC transporter permease [Fulvivirga imtechensis]ELR73470.1 ABC transporter, permease protein [Fulvivirga imtechensis AK7]